ncbi:type VII secretion-associated serine protease mycosin [Catenuloplanes indicus]|uniref:Type VII secretion-associated serine protease mycosin n=1 Tax=Catenuloplanes indicus TaxID=137267 RepID=A0AAE3W536_9ACTN|nr:type VII secretion-associated serine protease mycosin [Catenuloplanes indicus]MDQ0368500.1 type VII secretion-associated serine protease mycosin [Catenuloplanes indicus]
MKNQAAIFTAAITLILPTVQAPPPSGKEAQWHVDYMHAHNAHNISTGKGITVAVIDSGVQPHPDIEHAILPGISFLPGDNSKGQQDDQGHGTAIAGLIAGKGGTGHVLGIAPNSKILPIRILDANGRGDSNTTAKAIRWAIRSRAKIVNISSGGGPNSEVRKAVEEATKAGLIVVASSGNKPAQDIVAFPAYINGVVAVGATDKDGVIADISASGEGLLLTAPGVDLLSTSKDQRYETGTGTSGAAAIVSGVAALVWSRYPELSAAEVVHRMTATAVDKGAPGRDPEYGFGIVDPVAALTADVPPLAASGEPAPGGESAQATPVPTPNTPGQVAVILVAVIASLLAVALVVALIVLRGRARRNGTGG